MLKNKKFLVGIVVILLIACLMVLIISRQGWSSAYKSIEKKISTILPTQAYQFPIHQQRDSSYSLYCIMNDVYFEGLQLSTDIYSTLWTKCYFYDKNRILQELILPFIIEDQSKDGATKSLIFQNHDHILHLTDKTMSYSDKLDYLANTMKLKKTRNNLMLFLHFEFLEKDPGYTYISRVLAIQEITSRLGYSEYQINKFAESGDVSELFKIPNSDYYLLVPIMYSY